MSENRRAVCQSKEGQKDDIIRRKKDDHKVQGCWWEGDPSNQFQWALVCEGRMCNQLQEISS